MGEGLRAIGVPVVASVSGFIEGPMWMIVMNSDYRVCSNSTAFSMPLYCDAIALMEHLGQEPAKKCIMELGNWSALKAVEVGIVQSTQPKVENAKMEAFETAKRILRFPNLVGRKSLLGPPPEELGKKSFYRRMNLKGP